MLATLLRSTNVAVVLSVLSARFARLLKKEKPRRPGANRVFSKTEAEDFLDWLEVTGSTGGPVYLCGGGFAFALEEPGTAG